MDPSKPDRLRMLDLGIALLLFVGTFSLYWQVHGFAYLRFDDPKYIEENRVVLSGLNAASVRYAMTASVSGNWHPVTLLTEMLVVQFFGSSSGTMHLLCASIHSANAVLLYLFLRIATRRRSLALMVAMLWAWHPLRVESVAWVGELKDVLCGFFSLLTLLAFVRYRRVPGVGRYLAVAGCLTLALLSKSMAITLPSLLFLLNFWPLDDGRQSFRRSWWITRIREQLPLLALCAICTVVAILTQRDAGFAGTLKTYPARLRVTNGLHSYLRYIGMELVPRNMGLIYPHPALLGKAVPIYQWGSAVLILAIITAVAWNVRRSKPYLIIGWLWFVGTLVPTIGLIQLGEASMADRYTYIPSMGLTIAIVWLIGDWIIAHPRWRNPMTGLAVVIAVVLAGISYRQISFWKTNYILEAHSNEVIPNNFLAMTSLSMDATGAGQLPEAIRLATEAERLVPGNLETHHALALALRASGDLRGSFNEYIKSIRLDPTYSDLRLELGQLLLQQHRIGDARIQLQQAVDLDPDSAEAHDFLAGVLADTGDYQNAIVQWKLAVGLVPGLARAHGMLGDVLNLRGDRAGAIEHYRAALKAGATDPRWQASLTWDLTIDPQTPQADLQAVLPIAKQACDQTKMNSAFPLYAYAMALARLNRFDDAIEAGTDALHVAEAAHQDAMAKEIQSRLAAFRVGQMVK